MGQKFTKLILSNIKRRKKRSIGLIILAAILSFVLVAGFFVITGMRTGLTQLSDRLGADLMIVPLGYEENAESILIKGEPNYFYLDKGKYEELKKGDIEGIDAMSAQFYLTSSNQGCCDIPVQFIGIDENTDFTVIPWINEEFSEKGGKKAETYLKDGSIVVGSDIEVPEDGKLKFFDDYYRVSASLSETGTGLDQTVFADMETINKLYMGAKKKGFGFTENLDPEKNISSIMVRIKKGYSTDQVKHNIRAKIDGLQVIGTKSLTKSIEGSLSGFIILLYLLMLMLFILGFSVMSISFRLSALERQEQFKVMRTVGAGSGQISGLILGEAFVLSLIGSLAGVLLALLIAFSFNDAISDAVLIPFSLPHGTDSLIIFLTVFLTGCIVGPLSALGTARRLSADEVIRAWEG